MAHNKSNSTKQRGSWVITVPMAIGSVLFVVLVFLPLKKEIDGLRQTLGQKREFIASAEALKSIIAQTEKDIEQIRLYNDEWYQRAPPEAQEPTVHRAISDQIKRAGTTPTRFAPLEVEQLQEIRRVPIAVGASGTLAEIFAMLGNLENLPEFIQLEELRFEVLRSSPGKVHCDAQLVLYSRKKTKEGEIGESLSISPWFTNIPIRLTLLAADN